MNNTIFLLGNTGSGKSTIANILSGLELQKINPDQTGCKLDTINTSNESIFKIGHKLSETQQMQFNELQNSSILIDLPGYQDTHGSYQEILHGLNFLDLVGKVAQTKIIFMVKYASIESDRGQVKNVFEYLLKSIKNKSSLQNSVLLVVTQIENIVGYTQEETEIMVYSKIKNHVDLERQNQISNEDEEYLQFIEYLLNNRQIVLIQTCQMEDKYSLQEEYDSTENYNQIQDALENLQYVKVQNMKVIPISQKSQNKLPKIVEVLEQKTRLVIVQQLNQIVSQQLAFVDGDHEKQIQIIREVQKLLADLKNNETNLQSYKQILEIYIQKYEIDYNQKLYIIDMLDILRNTAIKYDIQIKNLDLMQDINECIDETLVEYYNQNKKQINEKTKMIKQNISSLMDNFLINYKNLNLQDQQFIISQFQQIVFQQEELQNDKELQPIYKCTHFNEFLGSYSIQKLVLDDVGIFQYQNVLKNFQFILDQVKYFYDNEIDLLYDKINSHLDILEIKRQTRVLENVQSDIKKVMINQLQKKNDPNLIQVYSNKLQILIEKLINQPKHLFWDLLFAFVLDINDNQFVQQIWDQKKDVQIEMQRNGLSQLIEFQKQLENDTDQIWQENCLSKIEDFNYFYIKQEWVINDKESFQYFLQQSCKYDYDQYTYYQHRVQQIQNKVKCWIYNCITVHY